MIKRLRVLALLLAVLMLCGCQNGNVTTVAPTTVPSGPANYTVKVVDPLGRPMENIGVKFIQGGLSWIPSIPIISMLTTPR